MKKAVLTFALLSLMNTAADARTLSPAEALARVAPGDTPSRLNPSRSSAATVPLMTVGSPTAPAVYVFDNAGGGYLIVSADDVAAPLLGYSDSGSFDPADMPANFRWWLGEYESQIERARNAGAGEYSAVSRADRSPIAPLVKTRWDQGEPYNNMSPELNGERTVTGCVATAMAQVMKYYNWPEQAGPDANFSYEWTIGGSTLGWNASGYRFDWNNMADVYGAKGTYTDVQANAVAALMKACGYSVDMQYNVSSAGGSGASTFDVANALVDKFGYDKGINVKLREYSSTEAWQDMIYTNLLTCGPVLYAGNNDSAGHAFVCDGYQGNGYFHFNWGWSGVSDGYFLLDALDPDNQGIGGSTAGYNANQMVILGVRKPVAGSKSEVYMIVDGSLTALKSGTQISIMAGGLYNYSATTLSGSVCGRIVPENGGAEKISVISLVSDLKPGYGYRQPEFKVAANVNNFPSNGTYRVYLAFKNDADGSVTDAKCTADQPGYVLVKRNASTYTVSVPESGTYSVTDMNIETPIYDGCKFLVTGNALWSGNTSVSKNIFGMLISGGKPVAIASTMPQVFKAGNEATHFDYLAEWTGDGTIAEGSYSFVMAMESNGSYKQLCNPVPVTVKANPGPADLKVDSWSVDNPDAVDPNNVTVHVSLSCRSGYYFDNIAAALFYSSSMSYASEFCSDPVSLYAGQSKELTFSGRIPGAVPGEKYMMAIYGDKQLSNAITLTVAGSSGIDDIEADAQDDGDAEYFNLQGIRVENPRNGVFIRRQGGKTTKVIIR